MNTSECRKSKNRGISQLISNIDKPLCNILYIPSRLVLTTAVVSCRCEILRDRSILQDTVWDLLSGVYSMNQLCKGSL